MVFKRHIDVQGKSSHADSFFNKKRCLNLLILLLSLVFVFGITEIVLRVFFKSRLELDIAMPGMRHPYRHDKILGWFPIKNSKRSFNASRPITLEYNSRGFRDIEHVVDNRPGIIFLGDSFVEGYDVEASERFTDRLRMKLPDWSVYNLGITGYGTDQEYILLKLHFDFYKPRIVFLIFCTDNDDWDNRTNLSCEYKPYFLVYGKNLKLEGLPVPRSGRYFFSNNKRLSKSYLIRLMVKSYFQYFRPVQIVVQPNPTEMIITDMNKFVRDNGSFFIVGLEDSYPKLEMFLKNKNIPYIDLSNPYKYPGWGKHWAPKGHSFVFEKIYEFLSKGNYLEVADKL